MTRKGSLTILVERDGDVIVTVREGDDHGRIVSWASVEFCEPSIGGGRSPRTHAALLQLAEAMRLDSEGDA